MALPLKRRFSNLPLPERNKKNSDFRWTRIAWFSTLLIMARVMVIQGRKITDGEIALIRDLMAEHRDWGRTRLSEELCRRWNWRNAQGRIKDMAARTLLLKHNGITANTGDLTGAFSAGVGEYDITITYANSATETVTVEVVDENYYDLFKIDGDALSDITEKVNAGLGDFYDDLEGTEGWFEITGSVASEIKRVDLYGDATKSGNYFKASGSIQASIGAADLKSPKFYYPPGSMAGPYIQLKASFARVSGTISGSVIYDDSQPDGQKNSGEIRLSGSSGITASVFGGVGCGDNGFGIEGKASTTLTLSGATALDSTEVKMNGKVKIDALIVEVFVKASFWGVECEKRLFDAPISDTVEKETGDFVIYTF